VKIVLRKVYEIQCVTTHINLVEYDLGKLIVARMVKKFSAIHGILKLISVSRRKSRTMDLVLIQFNAIQTLIPYFIGIYLNIPSHLCKVS
jgi:hypothetical protein